MQHDQTTKSFDPEGAKMKSWKDKYSQGGKYAVGIDWNHWQQFEDYGTALLEDPPDFAIYHSGDGKDFDRLLSFSRDFAEGLERRGCLTGEYHYYRRRRSLQEQLAVLRPRSTSPRPENALGFWGDFEFGAFLGPNGNEQYYTPADALKGFFDYLAAADDVWHRVNVYGNWGLRELARGLDDLHVSRGPISELHHRALWVPDCPARDGFPGASRNTKHGVREPGLPLDWPSWTIHQITSRGEVPGIKGNVNINLWNGNVDDMKRWAGAETQPFPSIDYFEEVLETVACALSSIADAEKQLGIATSDLEDLRDDLHEKIYQMRQRSR
jgi:GH25 family lysozyme M1 (1,4-beta-N-acetylmuramidase)